MMKHGDKGDVRPFLIKIGIALTLSLASFFYSRLRTRRPKPPLPPPSSLPHNSGFNGSLESRGIAPCKIDEKSDELRVTVDNSMVDLSPSSSCSGENNGLLLPEFNDLVKEYDFASSNSGKEAETPRSDVEIPKVFMSSATGEYDQEVRHLTNMVKMLQERERNLEIQLLEYYGLKEQETAVVELQNRLKINTMETKLLTLKIESLQADNKRLEAQMADHGKIVAELEASRSKIKVLKKKLRSEVEQNKEQILILQKRVAKLQEQEYNSAASDSDTMEKLQRLKVLEDEVEELRKCNTKLQLENSELAKKLESTQMLAISMMEDPEMESLNETSERLKQENESLTKEIEQLQADQCSSLEELVYLKWINACLRYELRNYQPPPGKTVARDLSRTLSPESEYKTKQLIIEYANTEGGNISDLESEWSSSQTSYTDSEILDDTSVDKSSRFKSNNSSKNKFFKKLRKLVLGKDVSSQNQGSSKSWENADSSGVSTATNTASTSEVPSNKVSNVSRSSYRHSFDIQGLERVKKYDAVDEGSGYTPFRMQRAKSTHLAVENQLDHDADLMKFAQVLKNNNGSGRNNLRRKSLSYDFG